MTTVCGQKSLKHDQWQHGRWAVYNDQLGGEGR